MATLTPAIHKLFGPVSTGASTRLSDISLSKLNITKKQSQLSQRTVPSSKEVIYIYTFGNLQVAAEMNCPLQLGLLAECLREKDVRSLLNIQVGLSLIFR